VVVHEVVLAFIDRCTTAGTASWNELLASRAWKKTSGFWADPRMVGASGVSPRIRCSSTRSSGIMARITSSPTTRILLISCEVRNPSKKCMNGTRECIVAAWEMRARSCASCTDDEQSIAQPVIRALITSE
jgi:hypothetical protein